MKTESDHFHDWESYVFGYGYGSGEEHTIPAIKAFFDAVPEKGCYDYRALEEKLTPTVAWLLINAFCKADLIEYGTSPRGGWLTEQGLALKRFVAGKTADELCDLTDRDAEYYECFPDYCNCGPEGKCHNPFWVARGGK